MEEAAPTGLSITKTHTLAFTPHAPDAEGYRVFASIAGAPAKLILTTKASGVALPKVAPASRSPTRSPASTSGVGWQSDPIGPVSFMAPPSGTQACTDAPQVTLGVQKLKKKLDALEKKKWRVADPLPGRRHGHCARRALARQEGRDRGRQAARATRRNVTVTLTIPKKPPQGREVPRDRDAAARRSGRRDPRARSLWR